MSQATVTEETTEAVEECRNGLPATCPNGDLVFGFDGVVDNVRRMIQTRDSSGGFSTFDSLRDIRAQVDDSIESSSSLTLEWETVGTRTGGHACHLSRGFNKLGVNTTMVGTYGNPPREEFTTEFEESTLVSVGESGVCDAVEFDDGKLMISETSEATDLDWDLLTDRIDPETLATQLDGTDVLGVGYWNVTSALPEILSALVANTWSEQLSPPGLVFLDPADVRNLPSDVIREGANHLQTVNDTVPVTVSANRVETEYLGEALHGENPESIVQTAKQVHDGLGVDRFVSHGVSRSITVSEKGIVDVEVPKTENPEMTTSAGDHFNLGFILGQISGLSDTASTILANAVAGSFVRNGTPPDFERIQQAVDSYIEKF
jgi:sugar/nucleoside kinase (ribokinase family)